MIAFEIQADRRCLLVGNSDRRSDGTSALNAGITISGGECTACPEDPPLSVVGPSPLRWYALSLHLKGATFSLPPD